MAEDAKKRNNRQYKWQKENKDRINLTMPKGRKKQIIEAAERADTSPTEWINKAIEARFAGELDDITEARKESDTVIDLAEVPELSIYARNYPGGAISDKEWIAKAVERMKDWQDHAEIEEIQRESI